MNPTTITELKHLQKEIDEAEAERNDIILNGFSSKNWDKYHSELGLKIETNQQRIKEIIEQL